MLGYMTRNPTVVEKPRDAVCYLVVSLHIKSHEKLHNCCFKNVQTVLHRLDIRPSLFHFLTYMTLNDIDQHSKVR